METLRVAIQKSGRLSEKSLELLSEAGINLANGSRILKAMALNYPLEILFLRDDDIPEYIKDGVADIGIVGENEVLEKGFELAGKRIATSYPWILGGYLKKQGISADIHVLSGSVEIAPGIGMAEGIFDIISTGSTLISNGLVEVETVMHSEAVIVSNKDLSDAKRNTLDNLIFRIGAVQKSRNNKYILLNAPNNNLEEIISVIPGMKSPTVMPLAEEGWSSVHSVLNENEFWTVIDRLKELGAQGILVIPIEKMIV